jgi:hypothetical protein
MHEYAMYKLGRLRQAQFLREAAEARAVRQAQRADRQPVISVRAMRWLGARLITKGEDFVQRAGKAACQPLDAAERTI